MPKTVNGNAADRDRGGGTNWTHSRATLEEGRIEDRGTAFAKQWDIDNDLKKRSVSRCWFRSIVVSSTIFTMAFRKTENKRQISFRSNLKPNDLRITVRLHC